MTNRHISGLLIIFIFLSIPACSKDEDSGETGQLGKIRESEPFATPFSSGKDRFRPESSEIEKATYAYIGKEIPESFPKELPVYSPSTVTSCKILGNEKGAIAVLLTRDTPEKIADFYLKFLKEKNWETQDRLLTDNIFSLMAKKEFSTIMISAAVGESGTTATIAISIGKK